MTHGQPANERPEEPKGQRSPGRFIALILAGFSILYFVSRLALEGR